MPPRYAYWTILIDQKPTAFRAQQKEDLLPTLHQLQRKSPDAIMKWFARGRLWDSPEQAQWSQRNLPKSHERRGREWRPGGEHKDPRARFDRPKTAKKPRDKKPSVQGAPQEPWKPKSAWKPRDSFRPVPEAGGNAPKAPGERPVFSRERGARDRNPKAGAPAPGATRPYQKPWKPKGAWKPRDSFRPRTGAEGDAPKPRDGQRPLPGAGATAPKPRDGYRPPPGAERSAPKPRGDYRPPPGAERSAPKPRDSYRPPPGAERSAPKPRDSYRPPPGAERSAPKPRDGHRPLPGAGGNVKREGGARPRNAGDSRPNRPWRGPQRPNGKKNRG